MASVPLRSRAQLSLRQMLLTYTHGMKAGYLHPWDVCGIYGEWLLDRAGVYLRNDTFTVTSAHVCQWIASTK